MPPIPVLLTIIAALTGFLLASIAIMVVLCVRLNRWRHAAAEWRSDCNVARRLLKTAWARKLGPDIDRETAERIFDFLQAEAEKPR